MAQPGNNGRSGFIATLVEKVLGWVDRPWRALFILALVLVLGIGYSVYDHRADLIRVFTAPSTGPVVLRSSLADVIIGLFYTTTADAIAIWAVDVGANRADLKLGYRRGSELWEAHPAHLQWITEQTDPKVAAKLFRGEAVCDNPAALKGVLSAFLISDGMNYACYVPEPPSSTEVAVGVVVLAWRSEPESGKLRASLAAVQAQTNRIIAR